MPPTPTRISGAGVDLGPRLTRSATVVDSPPDDTETIIASVTIASNVYLGAGVILMAFAAFTVGADGSAVNLRIRRTDVAGTVVKATGAMDVTAADLDSGTIVAFDTGAVLPNQVYVLTAEVTAGSAESVVSAVELVALAV